MLQKLHCFAILCRLRHQSKLFRFTNFCGIYISSKIYNIISNCQSLQQIFQHHSNAGILQFDWLKLVMWLSTANHSVLFCHSIAKLCLWRLQSLGLLLFSIPSYDWLIFSFSVDRTNCCFDESTYPWVKYTLDLLVT